VRGGYGHTRVQARKDGEPLDQQLNSHQPLDLAGVTQGLILVSRGESQKVIGILKLSGIPEVKKHCHLESRSAISQQDQDRLSGRHVLGDSRSQSLEYRGFRRKETLAVWNRDTRNPDRRVVWATGGASGGQVSDIWEESEKWQIRFPEDKELETFQAPNPGGN
jgi:hypothetical protein